MAFDTDVVIVGAGVAGLSAAKALAEKGRDFRLIEASHRIGGRAYSEAFGPDCWFDLGCSYLHEGAINPFTKIANQLNFKLGDGTRFDRVKCHLKSDYGRFDAAERRRFFDFCETMDMAFQALSQEVSLNDSDDVAIAELMDWNAPDAALYAHLMAGLNACDVTEQSAVDFWKFDSGLDYPVIAGLGQLVACWAGSLPVSLNCAVDEIEWRRGKVIVKTNQGSITARHVIITVSTGVLQSGAITFKPCLPDKTGTAISLLPCGTLNKIGLRLDPSLVGPEYDGWHAYAPHLPVHDRVADGIATVDINYEAGPQAIVFAGGSLGVYLERQGVAAMQDYAVSSLVDLMGSKIKSAIKASITTAWHADPLTLGSYSYAVPGGSSARRALAEPVEDTLFFAGEAVSENHFATCHGAFFSGVEAATNILGEGAG